MHYAVEGHSIVGMRALLLPMNALCRIVEIGCTIFEIRAGCLYLAGKGVYLAAVRKHTCLAALAKSWWTDSPNCSADEPLQSDRRYYENSTLSIVSNSLRPRVSGRCHAAADASTEHPANTADGAPQ